jgi:class 3 adenylate cyclase/pimeloyl-ACP methyl ester carboxylesterase
MSTRTLTVILAADAVGYSRLAEAQEEAALAAVAWFRERAAEIVAAHSGRVFFRAGDGVMAELPNVRAGVHAALELSQTVRIRVANAERPALPVRIAVHFGDARVEGDGDMLGHDVNVAARIQQIAEPGEVLVSRALAEAARGKVDATFERVGRERVKNLSEPIEVLRCVAAAPARPAVARPPVKIPLIPVAVAVAAVVAAALIAVVGAFWLLARGGDAQWLETEAIPRIEAYIDVGNWEGAYAATKEAQARVGDDPALAELWTRFSWRATIPSDPLGATVYRRAYDAPESAWEELGRTPLTDIRIPYGLSRLRFELEGHAPLDRLIGGGDIGFEQLPPDNPATHHFFVGVDAYRLDAADGLPDGAVRVPGWTEVVNGEPLAFNDYFIDRTEVTNAQFKAFVDAGGYRREEYWDPVERGGVVMPWAEVMALFVDSTGRPGPSTWVGGDYREGEDDFPVAGVSWYEAAAYARFMRRELPTAYHWRRANATAEYRWLIPTSNIGGRGLRAVGEGDAMSYSGAVDLAGNAREWTASARGDERVILGGAWDDPDYAIMNIYSVPALDRSPGSGFRLAVVRDDPDVKAKALAPLPAGGSEDVEAAQPVSDEVFAALSRVFAYERTPLNVEVEGAVSTSAWIRERITFDAAYPGERMLLYLYLPTVGSRPFQTVVYWPGGGAVAVDSIDKYAVELDFVLRSGRAVAFPVYKNSLDRGGGVVRPQEEQTPIWVRNAAVAAVNDLRRSIDYLETRPDIDTDRIGFYGNSWGAVFGTVALAQEPRIRAAVLQVAYLPANPQEPEVNPLNALPRVRAPMLVMNGEYDPVVPIENTRRFVELIGVPDADKRHVIAPSGHFVPRELLIRETLDWLDKYLGPPRMRSGGGT